MHEESVVSEYLSAYLSVVSEGVVSECLPSVVFT